MFYAILGIIVVVALFLIFREDHDKSYNKKEKEPRKAPKTEFKSEPKVEQPKAEKKASGASLKDQILGEIEAAIRETKIGLEEPMSAVRDAMDQAKTVIDNAMKNSQKDRNTPQDVDEQFPEEDN